MSGWRLSVPGRNPVVLSALLLLVGCAALLAAAGLAGRALTAPFAGAAPAPTVREFTLTAAEIDWEIAPGTTVRAWAYNGQMPGPELRVREGDTVRITLVNRLPVGTTVHWHGIDVPPAVDGPVGLNQAAVEPGEDYLYEFVATNPGSRMYHAHADPTVQIALGLYGPLVVEPLDPGPTYDREYTAMLNEWDLELTPDVATGKAPRGPRDSLLRGGELGTDLFLINGRAHEGIPPIEIAEGERVLIRLMNLGNLPHAIHTHGHSFRIVATDGNPVPEAMRLRKDTVLIGPGERYDLELLGENPGVWMVHCHMENHAANGMMTLVQYDGAVPTGPVAEFFRPGEGFVAGGAAHLHDAPPAAPSATTPIEPASPSGADANAKTNADRDGDTNNAPAPVPAPVGEAVEVVLLDDRFEPPSLTVAPGTTVRFVNMGANWHSVAAFDGSFDSGRLDPGTAFEIRFEQPGVVKFICKHHGLRGMVGQVTVGA
jgi:plastocyanin